MLCIGLLRREAPRNDRLLEQIFDNRYKVLASDPDYKARGVKPAHLYHF
jgi:hypothetical protein